MSSITARGSILPALKFTALIVSPPIESRSFFLFCQLLRVKTNGGDTRGNQSGPKSGTGHLEKSPGTDGSTKYTTNFSIQQRKTKEPPKRKWV